jgi:acetyl/propionyl-CoA carboxylase alpha subunit
MNKLLIANRGEIAVRIIRTARRMGIATVAIYSDADRNALHVRLADEAVYIGRAEASESYLDAQKVIAAALSSGADAIHPGYGFLSERVELVYACEQNGITFVGPPASAMTLLGSKTDAKSLAVRESVPIVPGLFDPTATPAKLKAAAKEIGYPVMLKAAAGGGGRGMRPVHDAAEFESQLATASDEALKSFGDGTMMVEKLVDLPRHIEVQILADRHRNVAALFERECSIQRRHQKIIEEAPSPFTELDWPAMREAATRLIRSAGYIGAGTVEFIVDTQGKFYFLEVNARLQVEHPVTEQITGLDLVEWQLRIARGERLNFGASLIAGDRKCIDGHSMEARIVAEDPARNFLPSTGSILAWLPPRDPGVRVDSGFEAGSVVSRYYDSMLAKVIAHAPTRSEAIDKLRGALLDFHVLGVQTNIAFLLDVLDDPHFRSGDIDTGFLGRHFEQWTTPLPPPELADIVESISPEMSGPWGLRDSFRN